MQRLLSAALALLASAALAGTEVVDGIEWIFEIKGGHSAVVMEAMEGEGDAVTNVVLFGNPFVGIVRPAYSEAPDADELESHAESAGFAEFVAHAESAENAESGSPAGAAGERSEPERVIRHSAFSIQHFRLSLPAGLWRTSLWSATEGTLADADAADAFSFDLPASGVWHWLRVREATEAAVGDAFSLWLRAE